MKSIRKFFVASSLMIALAFSTFAGEMSAPGVTVAGEISTPGVTADTVTEVALEFLLNVSSLL
jgi:hypothetical protein